MKTLHRMGIIGIVLASLSFLFICMFNNSVDYEAGLGWGMYAALYLIAYGIVGIVQSNKHKK